MMYIHNELEVDIFYLLAKGVVARHGAIYLITNILDTH